MDVSSARRVDRALGPWAAALGRGLPARPIPDQPRRVLLVKLLGFGSILLAGPLVAAARATGAVVELLTDAGHADLFEGAVDRVIPVRRSIADIARVVRALRVDPPDLVVDLEPGSALTGSLGRWIGAPAVGFALPGRVGLHERTARFRESVHAATNFLRLADVLGWPSAPREPLRLAIRPDDVRVGYDLVAKGERFAVLNPNAGELAPERRWPHFRALARRFELPVVVIGGPGDRARVNDLVGATPGARSALGLSLREVAAVLSRAAVVVSNDSGPAHLAAAVGAPTVVLFGPETPATFRPLGARVEVVYRPPPCSPCLSTWDGKVADCRKQIKCLADLGPDDVWAVVARCLA